MHYSDPIYSNLTRHHIEESDTSLKHFDLTFGLYFQPINNCIYLSVTWFDSHINMCKATLG